MNRTTTLAQLRQARAALPGTWGLVQLHGPLHAGKLSLLARARAECDHVGVSLIPNSAEPDLGPDLSQLAAMGVDLVWTPPAEVITPPGYQTWVSVERVSAPLEGKHQPDHFRAFATLTTRLFNLFAPTRAYYGEIDGQQAAVVRRLVLDLNYPLEVIVCPTVREPDGLAVSSHNAGLNSSERAAATVLYRALSSAQQAFQAGERDGDTLRAMLSSTLAAEPAAREEYVSVADPDNLDELQQVEHGALLSLAARIGKTRLVDCAVIREP